MHASIPIKGRFGNWVRFTCRSAVSIRSPTFDLRPNKNRTGPKTLPCGTPPATFCREEKFPLIRTICVAECGVAL